MNILQIKQIAIVDFLLAIGIRPAKETAVRMVSCTLPGGRESVFQSEQEPQYMV